MGEETRGRHVARDSRQIQFFNIWVGEEMRRGIQVGERNFWASLALWGAINELGRVEN